MTRLREDVSGWLRRDIEPRRRDGLSTLLPSIADLRRRRAAAGRASVRFLRSADAADIEGTPPPAPSPYRCCCRFSLDLTGAFAIRFKKPPIGHGTTGSHHDGRRCSAGAVMDGRRHMRATAEYRRLGLGKRVLRLASVGHFMRLDAGRLASSAQPTAFIVIMGSLIDAVV